MAIKTLLIHFLKLGVGIASTEMEYADSTSSDTPPTTGWQTTAPKWQDGHYIWTRTHIIYTNGKETYTSPVCTTGSKGDKGDPGKDGTDGEDGLDAVTISMSVPSIVHKKSATSARYSSEIRVYEGGQQVPFQASWSEPVDGLSVSRVFKGDGMVFFFEIKGGAVVNTNAKIVIAYKDVSYVKYIPITTVSDGDKGDPGERGAVLRGPQLWQDCGIGYCFEDGGAGMEWKDTVVYNNNTYSCIKSHVKTADNYPGSDEDVNNGYWRVGSPIELIVANIIMSRYQLVKNLGVETIEMKDSAGNIIFRAKDGEVLANKGTFNNISCDNGNFTNANVSGDLNLSTLHYLANSYPTGGTSAIKAKTFNLGPGLYVLPHLSDDECMKVVFYHPIRSRVGVTARVSCEGANDEIVPATTSYSLTSYKDMTIEGWCEMIGSNIERGKTTWVYHYIEQS